MYCPRAMCVICYLAVIRVILASAQCRMNSDCPMYARCFTKRCRCDNGFIKAGDYCVDIDECMNRNTCSAKANCENHPGGFSCRCKDGFNGDGNECIDRDECNQMRDAPPVCYSIETCQNTQGSFSCFCNGKVCHPSAHCIQDDRGRTGCVCAHGFEGSGLHCSDFDECVHGTHTCTDKEKCINTPGSFKCNGSSVACNGTSKCSCAIHYASVEATANTCTPIKCTLTDASACLGDNDYCDVPSGTTAGTCACKKNFDAVNLIACTRRTCANDEACTEANSACHTGANAGCGCNTLYTAIAETGACSTQKTCTVETVATACGTNTVCEESGGNLLCFCKSNYKASATGCVQKTCTDSAGCDPNSQCSSGKCVCADNFLGTSRVCECPTGFSLDGSVCKKNCTANSECGTNGACFKKFCECEPNYSGTAPTTCTQLTCSGNTTTNCAANSSCVADKCVCSLSFFVEGANKLVCASCKGIFCNFSLLMASLLMFFFAGKRFE